MKILVIIGTRPEAIKMAPLINRLKRVPSIETKVCNTGQHKHLVIPIFGFFGIQADFSIDTMIPNQGLHGLTAAIIEKTKPVFDKFQPDYVLVHGDTTTSFASALSAFYSGCKVAHVEAGQKDDDLERRVAKEAHEQARDHADHAKDDLFGRQVLHRCCQERRCPW